jgi:para-nitrobenzyl esterase
MQDSGYDQTSLFPTRVRLRSAGSGQDRYALSDKMSAAWAAFARTGNPNAKGLPHWTAFTADQRATMILNDECKLVNDPFKEERLAIAALPPAGPGRG